MIPLTKDVTTIGRKIADIILDDPKVSSTHCEIRRDAQKFILIDLKSTNGTVLNRVNVQKQALVDQDVIEVGSSTLCFFEDLREYHGGAEETTAGMRLKEESTSHKVPEGLTTTRTMTQPIITLEIIKGPNTGKKYKFKKSHITIGRNDADLVLVDLDISRAHCILEVLGPQSIFLKDMGSTNGTFLDGKKIQSEKISDRAEFTVGNTTLKLSLSDSDNGG